MEQGSRGWWRGGAAELRTSGWRCGIGDLGRWRQGEGRRHGIGVGKNGDLGEEWKEEPALEDVTEWKKNICEGEVTRWGGVSQGLP